MASDDLWQRFGPRAVVTGASSGIGEAYARALSAQGFSLVVAARRRERLDALARELGAHGTEVRVVEADLASPAGIEVLLEATRALDVGLYVSNAGFGDKGALVEKSVESQLAIVDVNCRGQLALIHAFATRLAARRRGALVVTASTAGFQPTPFTSTYGASKAFLLHLTEGLAVELRESGVAVQALCPGPTDTEGPRRTGVDPSRVPNMMTADEVVFASIRALGREVVVVPGRTNRVAALATRFVPRGIAARIAGGLIRRSTGG